MKILILKYIKIKNTRILDPNNLLLEVYITEIKVPYYCAKNLETK